MSLVLTESPELAAARAKLAADRVTVRREQVEWVPDIVAEGGAGYNFEAKETTAAAGVSIELPVFDRNQGTIRQAQLDYHRQQEEIRRTELMLQQQMANVYQQYLTALQIATEYDRVIIPEAELAYQELLESYKANRVDWPTVLDAQMDYFDSHFNPSPTSRTSPHERSSRQRLPVARRLDGSPWSNATRSHRRGCEAEVRKMGSWEKGVAWL